MINKSSEYHSKQKLAYVINRITEKAMYPLCNIAVR